jgi:hypothetical protein
LSLLISNNTIYASTGGYGVWKRPLSELISATEEAASQNASFMVFPNPTDGTQTIRVTSLVSEPLFVSLFDMTGREVQQIYSGQSRVGDNDLRADLGKLPTGMYVYRVKNGEQVRYVKTVKN